MQAAISARLLCCAQMISPGAHVVDIGTDHGYLPIYLIQTGRTAHVIATDLRQMPLTNAKRNATRFGVAAQIDFLCCDGLQAVSLQTVDTIVCAGMGSDLIRNIIEAAPWAHDALYTFVLQPQGTVHDLRHWLYQAGFHICQETLVRDGGFLYPVMQVQFAGTVTVHRPGEDYASPALLRCGSAYLGDYLNQMRRNLEKSVAGLHRARTTVDRDKLEYFETALLEITQMEKDYGKRA